jgi:hypothetical protein
MEPLVFDELALSGWLLHRDGKPINGIRAIVKRKFARRKIVRARRKRRRRDVEAAFPRLPDAKISGFLFELRLPLGRNHLTFQVSTTSISSARFTRRPSLPLPSSSSPSWGFQMCDTSSSPA